MRRIFSSTLVAALAFSVWVSVRSGHSQAKPKAARAAAAAPVSYGNVDSISQEEMKIYLYFLASDQLEGRNLPSRGLDTAALYIASHLAEWGLKPGGSSSADRRTAAALLHAHGTGGQTGFAGAEQGVDHGTGSGGGTRRRGMGGMGRRGVPPLRPGREPPILNIPRIGA